MIKPLAERDYFVFYVDVDRARMKLPKGHGRQSGHVGTVVVKLGLMADKRPYFRYGVAMKNQRDKLPFNKKDGRDLAIERADRCETPAFSTSELAVGVMQHVYTAMGMNPELWSLVSVSGFLERMVVVMTRAVRYRVEQAA